MNRTAELAAIEHYRDARPVTIPDTGTLHGDLLALLSAINRARATFWAVAAAAAFSGLPADTGLTPAQARDKVLGDQPLLRDQIVYRRAHDRGEIDLDRVSPAVLAMPFELMRHDLLMNLEPLPPARIESIIDELFLPLVRSHHGEPGAAGAGRIGRQRRARPIQAAGGCRSRGNAFPKRRVDGDRERVRWRDELRRPGAAAGTPERAVRPGL